jgi:ketosteroid isomerase-like protein
MTSNADIARRGYEAVRRGDIDAIRDFLAPDVKWHGGDPSAEGACRNRDEALNFMRQAGRRGPIAELIANLTTFRDGKAVEMVHFPDAADALAAAGVAVP